MTNRKRIKVIFDTNILISFLIGKKLQSLKGLFASRKVQIVLCEELLIELKEVSQRPKLSIYFDIEQVHELIVFLKTAGEYHKIKARHIFSKDPKDAFLLDLIDMSKANYLVTGDMDILKLKRFGSATIISPADFEREFTVFEK